MGCWASPSFRAAEALRRVLAGQQHGGARERQALARARVQVTGQGLVDQGELAGVGLFEGGALQGARRFALALGRRAHQLHAGQRVLHRAAQAVVDHDVAGVLGQRREFLAGHGVDGALAFGDEHPLALHAHGLVGHGLDQCGGTFVRLGGQAVERVDAGVGVAVHQRERVGRGERMRNTQ